MRSVRRYGKPAPQQEEPVADLTYAPETAEARPAKPKRFQTGAKVWLILCIIAAAFQTLSFFNLFYLYGNQDVFSAVFAAYPELSPMRDLLDMMMQSVSVYLWFYILEASLLLLKCAGLIWFAASARRTAFLATAIVAGLLCILTFVTAGLAQALLNAAGVVTSTSCCASSGTRCMKITTNTKSPHRKIGRGSCFDFFYGSSTAASWSSVKV